MKNFILLAILLLSTTLAFGAKLEDVDVLDMTLTKDGFDLKLRDLKRAPEGHFFVQLQRDDKEAFEKIALVMKKLHNKDSFKLVLDIKSFSAKPAGSKYKSGYVQFIGQAVNESLIKP